MRTLDFSNFLLPTHYTPFESIFDRVSSGYSPGYNLERIGENQYRISMSVAGFSIDDLSIEAKENALTISGTRKNADESAEMLVQGLAAQDFQRQFHLADYVEVKQASLENGILTIDLVRELPESLQARKIAINEVSPKLAKAA